MHTLVLHFLVGCGPSMPTDAQAQAAYQSRSFDAVEADIQKVLAGVPDLGGQPPPCSSSLRPVEHLQCLENAAARREDKQVAIEALREHALPELVDRHGLLGLELTHTAGGERNLLGHHGTQTPGKKKGSVDAAQGESIDGRQVGWGLYQDPAAGNAYRPGIEVAWSFPHGDLTVDARATAWIP